MKNFVSGCSGYTSGCPALTWDRSTATTATAAAAGAAEAGKDPALSAAASMPLAAGWTEQKDPESGDIYYWNEQTDETTWDRPTAVANGTSAPAQSAARHPIA